MHSRLSEPLVLELLLLGESSAAVGDAEPDEAEADDEEPSSPRTPESESAERIWKAADSEFRVEPMAVRGSELMRRAGGCSAEAESDDASEAEGNPKLLLRLATPLRLPMLPVALLPPLLLLPLPGALFPTNPKSVDQMLGWIREWLKVGESEPPRLMPSSES